MTDPGGGSSRMAPGSPATSLLVPGAIAVMWCSPSGREANSAQVGLGVVRSGVPAGEPLAQAGQRPDACEQKETTEHIAVVGELRQEDQCSADQKERDERHDGD